MRTCHNETMTSKFHWGLTTSYVITQVKQYLAWLACGFYFLFYAAFNRQGHIAMGSLQLEEPVHTTWSRFCRNWQVTINFPT